MPLRFSSHTLSCNFTVHHVWTWFGIDTCRYRHSHACRAAMGRYRHSHACRTAMGRYRHSHACRTAMGRCRTPMPAGQPWAGAGTPMPAGQPWVGAVITSCFPCWLNASNRALDKKWKSSVNMNKVMPFPWNACHYTPAHSFSTLCSCRAFEGVFSILSKPPLHDSDSLSACNHEEADSRMTTECCIVCMQQLLHANHAALCGHLNILIRTVETDVVVLAVSVSETLGPEYDLWLAFGTGKHFRYLAAHKISIGLGPIMAQALFYVSRPHRL